jgi:hypothetical protein
MNSIIHVRGDVRTKPFWLGIPYTFQYRLSTVYRRDVSTNGIIADTGGRLQLRSLSLDFNGTGYFRVEVTPKGRSTSSHIYSGRFVGVSDPLLGVAPVEDGSYKARLFSKNNQVTIDLVNDSFLPCQFTGAVWEGEFNELARKV